MKKLTSASDPVRISLMFIAFFWGLTLFSGCTKSPQSIDPPGAEQEFIKFNDLFKEGKPFYTLKEAMEIVNELMPEIETLAGKKFITTPKIRLIDTKMAETILKQRDPLTQNIDDIHTRTPYNRNQEKLFQIMSKTVGGIYEPRYKRLNLIPTHIEPMLRLMDLGYRHGMLVAKMIIAHELTHSLQDQHIDLDKKRKKAPGAEELHALTATIEGHATFIQKRVGGLLGVRYYRQGQRTGLEFENPLIKKVTSVNSPYVLKYTRGTQFIEFQFKKGGNRLLWEILKNPPVDTSMITYPETYTPKPYDTFNHKAILEDVYDFSAVYKNLTVTYDNFSLSKFSISYAFSDLEMPGKKNTISKISHCQNLLVQHKDITFAKIGFIVLKDEASALDYLELERTHKTQKPGAFFSDMQNNYLCKSDSIKIAREMLTHEKLKTWYNQEKLIKRKYAMFAKQNMIVTYSDIAFWLDYCEILKIAEKIFTRYENTRNNLKKADLYPGNKKTGLNHEVAPI